MTAHVTVIVWGKPHVVTVYQKSKSEWIVAGQHKNKQIQVTDSGYNAAIIGSCSSERALDGAWYAAHRNPDSTPALGLFRGIVPTPRADGERLHGDQCPISGFATVIPSSVSTSSSWKRRP